jgi:glycosyltransferase involved in cell wall biosynthesis
VLKPFLAAITVVMHIVDSDPVPRFERYLNHCLPQPDVALCVSAAMRASAVNVYGVAERRVRVLYNALDLTRLKPSTPDVRSRLRADWGIPERAAVVVSTSRFTSEKRLDVLIGLIPRVLKSAPETVFVFAGGGTDLDACRELAMRLGIGGSVRFLGHRSDIPDVLAASDVAVMLCLREAFGYSAAEAMALGVPVAAYKAAGLAEVITHGRSGLLAPAGDDATFAANLVRVLLDPVLRQQLGQGAREDVQRFGVAEHADKLIRLYKDLAPARSIGAHRKTA